MIRYLQIVLLSLLFAIPLSVCAGNCAKCGVVAPTGWKLCQRCKNEQEKLERAEARKKRKAEEEEARRKKEAEERAAKLKKLAATKPSPAPEAPAAAPTPAPPKPAAEAKPVAEVCPGLFGIHFGQMPDATFHKKAVVEDGRTIDRHFFTPGKQFRGFNEYSVRAGAGGVYEIAAHRRYVKGPDVDAKHAANAEFNDCVALLGKKFGKAMTTVEESLSARVSQIRFLAADGTVSRTVTIRLARDLDTAIDRRYDDNPDSLMAEMDRVFDLWIVASDDIEFRRVRQAEESKDLDAL